MSDELERLRADNATLRTALKNHGEEAARMVADMDELRDALMALLIAKDEKEFHGDTAVYQSLKRGAWAKARAAITKHSQTTTKEDQK